MGVWCRFRQAVVLAALGAVFSGGCGRTSRNARPATTADGGATADGAAGSAATDAPNCAVALSANGGRHCAVYQDGSVWCWGTQDQPAPADFKATSEPVRVPGVEHAVRIEVGPRHSCALTVAGSLVCWGDNESKQIDDSGTTPVGPTSPGLASFAPEPVKGFGLSDKQTCVVNFLSHVYCRGTDATGASSAQRQIEVAGDPDTTMPGRGTEVMDDRGQVFDITNWNKPRAEAAFAADNAWIGVNPRESCVIKRWGSLWCTEFRHEGLESVVLHGELALGEQVVQAGTGSSFVCALTDTDRVWCAGDNDVGQAATHDHARANGAFVDGLGGTRELAVNDRSACALEEDGSVWCWGAYADGLESDVPTQVSGCSRQSEVPPERQPFMGGVRDSAQHLAESGRALSQAMCACSEPVLTEACVGSGDLSPNPSCLDALASEPSPFWDARAKAQWLQVACLTAHSCQDSTAACPPPPSGDVTMSPSFDSYCKRRTCALDQEVNLSQRQICDGVVDCADGSDERNCQPEAQSFQCATATDTIALSHVCNSVPDCTDGSDEEYCE